MVKGFGEKQGGRFPLHRQNGFSTTQKPGKNKDEGRKIVEKFSKVRNLG